ncbi:MAG: hypothetical protein ACOYMS_04880 [Terrimicrobiaceae bacterium]
MGTALLMTVLRVATGLASEDEPSDNPSVLTANETLARAGFPAIPENARELECYAWTGLGPGISATFLLKRPALAPFPASFPGLDEPPPSRRKLLAPPHRAAPWFTPENIENGIVLSRGRTANAAPEIFRLHVDAKNSRVFRYSTWNHKRTHP